MLPEFRPATRVSTDIGEFEGYLRQAAEFVGRRQPNPDVAVGAPNKKGRFPDRSPRARVRRPGPIARPRSY
jgi:hypothetical protein